MADLLPSKPDLSGIETSTPRVIGLDDDDADDLLSALSSDTARSVLNQLHEEPTNASALADRIDTTLQNVQYHLGRLEEAGLIEVIDTVYSAKGREMKVYAPADRPLVVFAAPQAESTGLRTALSRLLGAVAFVALLSVLVQWLIERTATGGGAATADGAVGTAEVATRLTPEAAAATGLPPGVLFFLGGLSVVLVGFSLWFVQSRRRP